MRTLRYRFILISFLCLGLAIPGQPQSAASGSSPHPYHTNYWITGTVCGVGVLGNYLGIANLKRKYELSLQEIQALNKATVNGIDTWAFQKDLSKRLVYGKYSDYGLLSSIALPVFLMFDRRIRRDWFGLAFMYIETMTITTNIYEWSFLGPNFQNRIRPLAYDDRLTYEERKAANNRNSFYSGHVASAAASSFFMAKVYCDNHPGLGNDKYLLYGAALIPPLIVGFFRMKALKHFPSDIIVGLGVGALCGLLVPEFHRTKDPRVR
jgi:membrane-associated phospholipid phosphatase